MDYKERRVHGEEGLPVSMYELTPGSVRYRMNCHWHPEHEIIFVQRGNLQVRLNDDDFAMAAGDVLFVQGGTLHSAQPSGCHYICFVVDPVRMLSEPDACSEAARKLADGELKVRPLVSAASPVFRALAQDLCRVCTRREDGFAFLCKGLMLQFFGHLLSLGLCTETTAPGSPPGLKNAGRMKRVLDYIKANYAREISLSELAGLADMQPNYFCRSFCRLTGQTPINYLITYRLESARYALRESDLSVTDVAFACGFNDTSHFIKMFRRAYHTTPKAYRNSTR